MFLSKRELVATIYYYSMYIVYAGYYYIYNLYKICVLTFCSRYSSCTSYYSLQASCIACKLCPTVGIYLSCIRSIDNKFNKTSFTSQDVFI